VELSFQSLADFGPAGVARQLTPLLEDRLRTRRKLEQLLALLRSNGRLVQLVAQALREPRQGLDETFEWVLLLVSEGDRRQSARLLASLRHILDRAPPDARIIAGEAEASFQHWIGLVDAQLSAQVTAVLRHPDFRRLEATWRGLHYLVEHADGPGDLAVRVLNVSKKDLLRDLEKAADFDQTQLFRRVCEDEYGRPDGEPYGLLVADYEFGRPAADVALLRMAARVAAASQTPLVAAAAPDLVGLHRFADWTHTHDPAAATAGDEYRSWKTFRDAEEARYVALTLPRVLARPLHQGETSGVTEFTFNEQLADDENDNGPLMSVAWVYAARVLAVYARYGWLAQTRGPACFLPEEEIPWPTEVALGRDRELVLSRLGFLPLDWSMEDGHTVFLGAASCHRPRRPADGGAGAAAELAARFDYLHCATLFVRRLLVLARAQLGLARNAAACERRLGEWLADYVLPNPAEAAEEERARRPLAEARVEVREVQGRFALLVRLRPAWQFEELDCLLRLVVEVPGGPA
jgi:type VI secretion system protein ImpC